MKLNGYTQLIVALVVIAAITYLTRVGLMPVEVFVAIIFSVNAYFFGSARSFVVNENKKTAEGGTP